MLFLALLLQSADPAALLATERARTAAEARCVIDPDATDITVCGLRRADRFRVPFAAHIVARTDDVSAERAQLLHQNSPLEDHSPFLVGGGMVGAQAGTSFGPGARSGAASVGGLRPLAK